MPSLTPHPSHRPQGVREAWLRLGILGYSRNPRATFSTYRFLVPAAPNQVEQSLDAEGSGGGRESLTWTVRREYQRPR
jgi:hypothetical protein